MSRATQATMTLYALALSDLRVHSHMSISISANANRLVMKASVTITGSATSWTENMDGKCSTITYKKLKTIKIFKTSSRLVFVASCSRVLYELYCHGALLVDLVYHVCNIFNMSSILIFLYVIFLFL